MPQNLHVPKPRKELLDSKNIQFKNNFCVKKTQKGDFCRFDVNPNADGVCYDDQVKEVNEESEKIKHQLDKSQNSIIKMLAEELETVEK